MLCTRSLSHTSAGPVATMEVRNCTDSPSLLMMWVATTLDSDSKVRRSTPSNSPAWNCRCTALGFEPLDRISSRVESETK